MQSSLIFYVLTVYGTAFVMTWSPSPPLFPALGPFKLDCQPERNCTCTSADGKTVIPTGVKTATTCACFRDFFSASSQGEIEGYIPRCDPSTGTYQPLQQYLSVGLSWCVDAEGRPTADQTRDRISLPC